MSTMMNHLVEVGESGLFNLQGAWCNIIPDWGWILVTVAWFENNSQSFVIDTNGKVAGIKQLMDGKHRVVWLVSFFSFRIYSQTWMTGSPRQPFPTP